MIVDGSRANASNGVPPVFYEIVRGWGYAPPVITTKNSVSDAAAWMMEHGVSAAHVHQVLKRDLGLTAKSCRFYVDISSDGWDGIGSDDMALMKIVDSSPMFGVVIQPGYADYENRGTGWMWITGFDYQWFVNEYAAVFAKAVHDKSADGYPTNVTGTADIEFHGFLTLLSMRDWCMGATRGSAINAIGKNVSRVPAQVLVDDFISEIGMPDELFQNDKNRLARYWLQHGSNVYQEQPVRERTPSRYGYDPYGTGGNVFIMDSPFHKSTRANYYWTCDAIERSVDKAYVNAW